MISSLSHKGHARTRSTLLTLTISFPLEGKTFAIWAWNHQYKATMSLSLSLSLSLNMEKVSISWFMTSTFDNLYISFPLYFSVLFIEYYSFNIMLQLTKDNGQKVTFTWMWIIRMTNISAKKVIKFKLIQKKKKILKFKCLAKSYQILT